MASDPTVGLTDDELVEVVAREEYEALTMPLYWTDVEERVREGYRKFVRRILARIRRPLVARGIEAAADACTEFVRSADEAAAKSESPHGGNARAWARGVESMQSQLRFLARQHAAGEDADVRLCGDGRAERG